MDKKNLIPLFAVLISLCLIGCDRVANEVLTTKNKWSLGERVDKITGSKTLVASARLIDDAQPTKYVDTEISCSDGKKANIEFVLHTTGDTADSQSIITSDKNVSLLRMRSGDLKFVKMALADFSNQAVVSFEGIGGYMGLGASMLGASVKPLEKEMVAPELHVEIPSKYGSPVILIALDNSSVISVFDNCGIVPAYKNPAPTGKNLNQQNLDKCVDLKVSAYRKEKGEDAMVRQDMLDEWSGECKGEK
jgi:hypothetical protein